jgi:hypothetical protein
MKKLTKEQRNKLHAVPNCKNEYHALATYLNKTPGAWELWYPALDKYIEQQHQ